MATFDQTDYTKFVADYSVKNGELADEFVINLSPQRIKKELNNVYNMVRILNGERLLNWNPVEDYLVGELVQNYGADDKYYRARRINTNKRPDLFPDLWEEASNTDYTAIGDFTNYLAKDNTESYAPTGLYNPATKGYVDYKVSTKLDIDGKAADSSKLNGEVVVNTLGTSMTAPASQNLVNIVDNKVNTKLDASEFNATNVMAMVQNLDGAGSGLNADTLDGMSSEEFMKVGSTTNFDTMLTPGTYIVNSGGVGAPNMTGTFALCVTGTGSYFSQIATSVTENKLYYRSYVGTWSAWKEFASATGSIATAAKLASPVTIALSGDVTGSTSFDGSQNVTITSTVLNDSHTHDTRYYTEIESDARFLPLHAKADNSELLDGLNAFQFIRSDEDDIMEGNYTITGDLTVSNNLIINGTTTTINTETLAVEDKNIELGKVATPTDDTADFGGITLKAPIDKYIRWEKSDNRWHVSPEINANLYGTARNAEYLNNAVESVTAVADTIVKRDSVGDINGTSSDSKLLNGAVENVAAVPNTIVKRDASGNINGTASTAKYADLGEKYTSDSAYAVGTVLTISKKDTDVTMCLKGNIPFGVVSDKPGFVLDNELEDSVTVALIGKTPVLVKGIIEKGDPITSDDNGVAVKADYGVTPDYKIIGRALEANETNDIKLIKCFVRI